MCESMIVAPGVDIVAVYDRVGSGIVLTDTYVYMCEESACRLLAFVSSPAKDVAMQMKKKPGSIQLKGSEGEVASVLVPELDMVQSRVAPVQKRVDCDRLGAR